MRKRPQRARICAAAALTGFILLLEQQGLAASSRVTGGMVRYDHPVYHNGVRVLWHGAWRGRAGRGTTLVVARVPARAAIVEKPAPQSPSPAAQPAPQSQPIKAFSIIADPDDLTATRMANDFAGVLTDKGSPGHAIVGPTSPTGIAKVMRSGMSDFAVVTLDTLAIGVKYDPDWPKHIAVVAKLAPESIEIVAPKTVKSISDLQGKTVSFGDPDSTTGISARLLFSRLGVSVIPSYEPLTDALSSLSSDKVGAVVVLGGKDARALSDFGDDGRFHLVPISWSKDLEQSYAPTRVTAAERPNLVPANDAVETVAEPLALVALDVTTGSQRADALGKVAHTFLDGYDAFLAGDKDPHWRDVNLAADTTMANIAWTRIASAQGWLDERKTTADATLDAFRETANKAADASGGPTADDLDRLYDNLTRWRSLMQ